MSAYTCSRCSAARCTSDCVPGEIYGELACEFCTDDFETALEEYKAAAEVLERECKNCRHPDPDTESVEAHYGEGVNWCRSLDTSTPKGFGCNRFEGKE